MHVIQGVNKRPEQTKAGMHLCLQCMAVQTTYNRKKLPAELGSAGIMLYAALSGKKCSVCIF